MGENLTPYIVNSHGEWITKYLNFGETIKLNNYLKTNK